MKINTFEDLLELGTEKIHERTHISRDKIELVMTKSFAQIGKVQFMGYISILEREYGIDLSDIRREYTDFYQTHSASIPQKQSVILQASSDSKSKWVIVGAVIIVLLMVAGYFLQSKMSAMPSEEVMNLTTQAVEVAEEVIEVNASDVNETNGTLITSVDDGNQTQPQPTLVQDKVVVGTQITIRPSNKLWYGLIDIKSGERIQGVTSDPIAIDATKNWLIFFGHGRIEIESKGAKTVLKEKETVRFSCIDGVLQQISRDEFMKLNHGKNW